MIDMENGPSEAVRLQWKEHAAVAGKVDGEPSPVVMEAMHGFVCETCGAVGKKNAWLSQSRFCSKDCRRRRNVSKKRNSHAMSEETKEPNFNPLKIRAYHHPLEMLLDVVAIDWPANKVYGTLPHKNDYPMNFPLNECAVMTNMGGLVDQNGKEVFEGDVASFDWEDENGQTGGKIVGTVGFDRDVGGLYIVERTDSEEKRRFKLNSANQKCLAVLGCAFTVKGEVAPAAAEAPKE